MTSHEIAQLRADMEALQTDQEMLNDAFRQIDGEAHQALTIAKSNIKLMSTLRATQLEHSQALEDLNTRVTAGFEILIGMIQKVIDQDGKSAS